MKTKMSITILYNSDILESDAQVIVQQCNCVTKSTKGLSAFIAAKFPYADFYSQRKEYSTPGTIKMAGNRKKKQRFILGLFAQYRPGKPKGKETAEKREGWFKECLGKMSKIKGLKSVDFPCGIGCGLAGGCWDNYYKMIEEWANSNPDVRVRILNLDPCPVENNNVKFSNDIYYLKWLWIELKNNPLVNNFYFENYYEGMVHSKFDSPENEMDFFRYVIRELGCTPFICLDFYVQKYKDNFAQNAHMQELKKCFVRKKEIVQSKISEDECSESEDEPSFTWEDHTLLEYTKYKNFEGWEDFFDSIIEEGGLDDISDFLETESKNHIILPAMEDVYAAFEWVSPQDLKVVIIGQDPYHTPGAAMGLAFGHHDERKKIQPSLRNIYKAAEQDGVKINWESGDLSMWCLQGVFLINTALTVRQGSAGSHATKSKTKEGPWEYFIGQLFRYINEYCDHMVVMMWGVKAQNYSLLFDEKKHFLIKAPHPAASSYNPKNTEFLNHKPFSLANKHLKMWGKELIDWDLD